MIQRLKGIQMQEDDIANSYLRIKLSEGSASAISAIVRLWE